MIGAIAGDVIGSMYEFMPTKSKDFELFVDGAHVTDDSLLTIAVAAWILDGAELVESFRALVLQHPAVGWGSMFHTWAHSPSPSPYNSYGNGSAMRVAPVGFACETLDEVLARAEASAAVTHNHPEGVRGAQAVAAAIFLARAGADKAEIRREVAGMTGYRLDRSVDEIRDGYRFDETCQGSVPEAIIAFLDSTDFEDAVRNAVSLGGDADTQACIAGGIAEAFYGRIDPEIRERAIEAIPPDLIDTVLRFEERFGSPAST